MLLGHSNTPPCARIRVQTHRPSERSPLRRISSNKHSREVALLDRPIDVPRNNLGPRAPAETRNILFGSFASMLSDTFGIPATLTPGDIGCAESDRWLSSRHPHRGETKCLTRHSILGNPIFATHATNHQHTISLPIGPATRPYLSGTDRVAERPCLCSPSLDWLAP